MSISPETAARAVLANNVRERMRINPAIDTQAKLSKVSGVGQAHISRILNERSGATIDVLVKLAAAFKCQPFELLLDGPDARRRAFERLMSVEPVPDAVVAKAGFAAPAGIKNKG